MAVKVRGIRELQRAALKADVSVRPILRARLKEVGEAVRAEAATRLSPLSDRSASGYRVYVRQRGVGVEQARRRTTGKRPDWGAFQMRRILIPALEAKEDDVRAETEKAIDDIARIFAS